MGEDFEVDTCPSCGSTKVDVVYDEFHLIRLSLTCRRCHYIEATNPGDNIDDAPKQPWQQDPEWWK